MIQVIYDIYHITYIIKIFLILNGDIKMSLYIDDVLLVAILLQGAVVERFCGAEELCYVVQNDEGYISEVLDVVGVPVYHLVEQIQLRSKCVMIPQSW